MIPGWSFLTQDLPREFDVGLNVLQKECSVKPLWETPLPQGEVGSVVCWSYRDGALVGSREAWRATVHRVEKSQTWLSMHHAWMHRRRGRGYSDEIVCPFRRSNHHFSSFFCSSVLFRPPALFPFRKHWTLHCLHILRVPLSHEPSGFQIRVWK